jgi:putative transcriptional regulator
MSIGSNVRKYRKLKGLTQKELARKVSISRSFLSEIENGKYDIRLSLLDKICEVLGCDITDLLEYIPNKKKK